MKQGVGPAPQSEADFMADRDDRLSHLIAVSMDSRGIPVALFTTNRWVTAENWYAAEQVCDMVDRFDIDHSQPSWPTNLWITAMLRLFRPQIADLLHRRDAAVEEWRTRHPDTDVFEDRGLEVTSWLDISVDDQVRAIETALHADG